MQKELSAEDIKRLNEAIADLSETITLMAEVLYEAIYPTLELIRKALEDMAIANGVSVDDLFAQMQEIDADDVYRE